MNTRMVYLLRERASLKCTRLKLTRVKFEFMFELKSHNYTYVNMVLSPLWDDVGGSNTLPLSILQVRVREISF